MFAVDMHGMSMGGGGGSSQGMAMGHVVGSHTTLNRLPEWVGIVGVLVFILVAWSHLRHLVMASGERRW